MLNKRWEVMDVVSLILLSILTLLISYPIYNALIISVSSVQDYTVNPSMLFPKSFQIENYKYLFARSTLITGYRSTIIITIVGTALSLMVSVMTGYALSRKGYPGRKLLFKLMLFTMFFNGGLVPTYLQMKNMNLLDSLWSIILLVGITPYNIIIIKNSFGQTPESIQEAAKVDGANEMTIFFKVMLPLQIPIVATFGLFIAVSYWNEWYWSMLLLNKRELMTLQLVLRSIINEASGAAEIAGSVASESVFSYGVKMAAVVATMLPVMVIYPFIQKYFTKGILVGAIKE